MKGKGGSGGGGGKKAKSKGQARRRVARKRGSTRGRARKSPGGGTKGRAPRKRGGGRPGSAIPVGSRFMRTVTTAKITELRDANARDSEDYRVYDACLMRRTKRMSLHKIADLVGIPYETLRRRLIACNSRKEAIRHPDKKYIERGKNYALIIGDNELYGGIDEMNDGKNGRPFTFGEKVFVLAAIYKAGVNIAYRPLEKVIRIHAGGERRTPSYSQLRKRGQAIKIESGDVDGTPFLGVCGMRLNLHFMIGDGTSMKSTSRNEYRQAVYGNSSNQRYKFALMINASTYDAVFLATSSEPGKGESGSQIASLLSGAMERIRRNPNASLADTVKILYDGAADKEEVYAAAAREGCELVAPVRVDSSSDTKPRRRKAGPEKAGPEKAWPEKAGPEKAGPEKAGPETLPDPPEFNGAMLRRQEVYRQNGGLDSVTPENKAKLDAMSDEEVDEHRAEWRVKKEYSKRVLVESWFSAFKRVVGDEITSRKAENMEQELLLKVGLYNHMNDDAVANGYTGTRVVIHEGWAGSRASRRAKGRTDVEGTAKARKAATTWAKKGIG